MLTQHGWVVEQTSWDPPPHETEDEARDWACLQLAAAAPDSGRVLVVGKSLATFSAPMAAERGYDAIWLTPLLTVPALAEAFSANPARQLLVGGTRDDVWDPDVADRLAASGCDVLQVRDADHGMLVPGDIVRGAEIHVEVTRAMVAFVASLPTTLD